MNKTKVLLPLIASLLLCNSVEAQSFVKYPHPEGSWLTLARYSGGVLVGWYQYEYFQNTGDSGSVVVSATKSDNYTFTVKTGEILQITIGFLAHTQRCAPTAHTVFNIHLSSSEGSQDFADSTGAVPIPGSPVWSYVQFIIDTCSSITIDHWPGQNSGITESLWSVKAVDQSVVWAAGDSGKVLMTTNGGNNWKSVGGGAIGVKQLYAIEALSVNTAFVITPSSSGAAFIYRTTNGGTTWEQVFSQSSGYFDGIKMFDANNGIALGDPVGGKWTVLRTTDGGAVWGRIATEPARVDSEYGWNNSLATLGALNIWFGTNSNRIYRSTDGGMTWSSGVSPHRNNYSIEFADAQHGLAGSDSGYIVRTTDGGITWSSATTLPNGGWVSGLAGLGNDLFCTAGYGLYCSTDQGTTWTKSFSGFSPLNHLSLVANGSVLSGWTVGDNGSIFAFSGTITGVENIRTSTPTRFSLQQNYPNPFNPSTSISFSLPTRSFVSLKVFDLLGREVATIVSEEMSAGNYTRQWNAANMPSGVYFYRLQVGSYTETKKLVVLK